MSEHEPIWVWQVLDPRDGRWGTISCYLATPASHIRGDGDGHNVVLQTRDEGLARGPYKELAETSKAFGNPVRLVRYTQDPGFEPETL